MPIGNPVTLTSNVASKTISVTATASQTLFNVTGGYRINELGVFKNGLRLQDGVDYTARDGLTVTLLSAASGGDKLQFVVFDTFRVAEAIRPNVDEQTIRGNLNVVGILSATSLGGLTNFNLTSGITTFNDVRVGGALTVAGELTFEDVTNVDSVGYATFRSGINVQGAGSTTTTLNVTGVATVGSNISIGDSIFHTGDGGGTTFGFPAADTFTVYTAGSEALRVDSSRRLLLGTNTARSNFFGGTTIGPALQIEGSTTPTCSLSLVREDATGDDCKLLLAHVRGTAYEILQDGDALGSISWQGADGSRFQQAALIRALVDGTPGSNDMPGRLVFSTTADGASSPTERMRISANGNLTVDTDTFFVDAVNNRVGVGTTIPANVLHIAAAGNCSATIQAGTDSSSSNLTFGDTSSNIAGQISYLHSTDAMTFRTGGSGEDLRIDSSGRLLVGTDTARNTIDVESTNVTPYFQIEGGNSSSAHALITRYANNNFAGYLSLAKTRSSTVGNHAVVDDNDSLGRLRWLGDDGTDFEVAAQIEAFVDLSLIHI